MTEMIAVIPARGGSKRIPRKNIIDFVGKPMIAWTIDAARQSGLFSRVLVSTDDASIAAIAIRHGADAPFLRDSAADDETPISQATLAALRQAQTHWDERYSTVVQLMPNCPLRGADNIAAACKRFRSGDSRFLISCCRYSWMNPWWAHRLDETGKARGLFQEAMGRRSQDLEPLYCPTGAIWIADVAALQKSQTFYGPGYIFHPLHWTSAVDIDTSEDLEMAKVVYHMRQSAA